MLDLKLIREAPERVRASLARRGKPEVLAAVDEVLALDERRRALIVSVDGLRARRNEVSPAVVGWKQGRHDEAER
jgi:seryl-tRNA synthetase